MDEYLSGIRQVVSLTAAKFVAVDSPTGAGKTHHCKEQLAHKTVMDHGIKAPWVVIIFRVSLVAYYYAQLKDQGFVHYEDSDLSMVTPVNTPRLIFCPPSVAKFQHYWEPAADGAAPSPG